MKSLMRKLFVFSLALGVIAGYSSISFGWSHNEHQQNNTGATAYDVVKILDGDYTITEMMEWDFLNHEYYHREVNGKMQTVLRWWNGQVPAGTAGDVCFTATPLGGSASHAPIIGAWWTDEHGNPIGTYYPAASVTVDFPYIGDGFFIPVVHVGNFQAAEIKVNENDPDFWKNGNFELIGQAAPLPVHAVKVAVVDEAFTPRTLNLENTLEGPLANQFFDILLSQDGTPPAINYGDVLSLPLGNTGAERAIHFGQSLVVVVDLGGGNYDFFNFEAPLPSACGETDIGILDIKDAEGKVGEEVIIAVRIQGASSKVLSVGFDLAYDWNILSFVGFAPGPLSQSFELLKAADLGGGHLRIGGIDTAGNVAIGSSGDLILLRFLIIDGAENQSYPLTLFALTDDVAYWPASGGCLTIIPDCNGDLNGDGAVTPADARIALQCYLLDKYVPCADANGDGVITPADALCIFQKFLGIPCCLD
ncbi:MAG: cohesin domain-containing protein [bacterium]